MSEQNEWAPTRSLPQSAIGLLGSPIFLALLSPPRSLFTGYCEQFCIEPTVTAQTSPLLSVLKMGDLIAQVTPDLITWFPG